METNTQTTTVSKKILWASYVLSALPVLALVLSAVMKFAQPAPVVEGFEHLGWPLSLALVLAIIELACTVIYVIPRTAALGAIFLTGYLGGAVATHLRVGDHGEAITPAILGVLTWLGLYLRDLRLRELVPLRSSGFQPP